MWTLLKILLFGATVVVHPGPIEIGAEPIVVTPQTPLTAITSGANLDLDVTSYFPTSETLVERFRRADVLFPSECAHVTLMTRDGKSVLLTSNGISVGEKDIRLVFSAKGGVPEDPGYVRIELSSQCPIKGKDLRWHNATL
jgi:hypothetical protein